MAVYKLQDLQVNAGEGQCNSSAGNGKLRECMQQTHPQRGRQKSKVWRQATAVALLGRARREGAGSEAEGGEGQPRQLAGHLSPGALDGQMRQVPAAMFAASICTITHVDHSSHHWPALPQQASHPSKPT